MFKKITRSHLEPFLSKYATTEKVLDVGSGGSSYQRFFPNRLSVDIDPARKPDVVADAHSLPFKEGEFGFVLSTEMLEHVQDPKKVVSELMRVLRPGGTLVLTTRFVYPLHDAPHDYWRFTKYGLRELFKEWEVVQLVAETSAFSTIAALMQRISFQTRLRLNKPTKLLVLLLAWIFNKLDFLVQAEYADIKKSAPEDHILTTGYYIVVRKQAPAPHA